MDMGSCPSAGMEQAKLEMIQEPFLAMQGDPRRFTGLQDGPCVFMSRLGGCNRGQVYHEKRGEIGLLKWS
jgi:hypothetical protein